MVPLDITIFVLRYFEMCFTDKKTPQEDILPILHHETGYYP